MVPYHDIFSIVVLILALIIQIAPVLILLIIDLGIIIQVALCTTPTAVASLIRGRLRLDAGRDATKIEVLESR